MVERNCFYIQLLSLSVFAISSCKSKKANLENNVSNPNINGFSLGKHFKVIIRDTKNTNKQITYDRSRGRLNL